MNRRASQSFVSGILNQRNRKTARRLVNSTCWRLPFLVMSEKAMVLGGVEVPSLGLSSPAVFWSRGARRIGSGTSNKGLRSNLRESILSDIIFASSLSNSASASGSRVSSWRVTTMSSSKSESGFVSPFANS